MLREEGEFERNLEGEGLRIVEVGGDGNCLFRAISHQVYGTEDHHRLIRVRCIDYIQSEK